MMSRRILLGGGLGAAALSGAVGDSSVAVTARLKARPGVPVMLPPPPGMQVLGLDRRDAHVFIPSGIDSRTLVPLIVMFHGRGQRANEVMGEWKRVAARRKCLVLAPQAREFTWDVSLGPAGPDAQFVDRALQAVFDRFSVDPAHIAVAGFSDGASYALSIGLVNGDFFSDILAFAPIRYNAPTSSGRPRIFFSNGNDDPGAVLTYSTAMARQLRADGYDVAFHEFNGGHWIDEDGIKRAMNRFLGG